jgi:hypothetical protein
MVKLLYTFVTPDGVTLDFYDNGCYESYRVKDHLITKRYLVGNDAKWKIKDGEMWFKIYDGEFKTVAKDSVHYHNYAQVADAIATVMLEKAIWGDE